MLTGESSKPPQADQTLGSPRLTGGRSEALEVGQAADVLPTCLAFLDPASMEPLAKCKGAARYRNG